MPVSHTSNSSRPAALAVFHVDVDGHFAPFGELDGVADEVDQDLPEPPRVADQCVRNVRLDVVNQLEALRVRAQRQRLEDFPQAVPQAELDRLEVQPARLDLREIEDVVQDRQQRIGGGLQRLEVLALFARQRRCRAPVPSSR